MLWSTSPFFFCFFFAPKFGKPTFQNLGADDRPGQSRREATERHRVSGAARTRAPWDRAAPQPQPYFKKTPIKKLTMALPSKKNSASFAVFIMHQDVAFFTREFPRQRTLPTKSQTKSQKKNLGRLPTESLKWLNSEQHLTAHGPGDHSVYYMVHMATTGCHANGQGRKNP